MKKRILISVLALGLLLALGVGLTQAQGPEPQGNAGDSPLGTAFTYQARLTDEDVPADGDYDFEFKLYHDPDTGTQVGSTRTLDDVPVTDGLFTVELDFGDVFDGTALWLEVGVRRGDETGAYTTLSPRHELTGAPYAFSLRPGAVISDTTSYVGLNHWHLAIKAGVYAKSEGYFSSGVYGESDRGFGVCGGSDSFYGVYGYSDSSSGVYGESDSSHGVYGESDSSHGVRGWARADSGETYGVYGKSDSPDGAGVYAQGAEEHSPDLILGGRTSANDNGTLSTDPNYSSSDLFIRSNDEVNIHLDDNNDEDANFRIFNGDNSQVFRVYESGTTQVMVLQITGGSDLAEPFEIAGRENVEPGMVVAIDPEHPGQLRIADEAYDRTVAGCVSGANGIKPGLTMQQESTAEGSFPVALSGRVYCWADASYGPIQPGDLLTTSDTPGHAMKVTDYERAQGAILGKAMTSLTEGQGLILVLVSLQ